MVTVPAVPPLPKIAVLPLTHGPSPGLAQSPATVSQNPLPSDPVPLLAGSQVWFAARVVWVERRVATAGTSHTARRRRARREPLRAFDCPTRRSSPVKCCQPIETLRHVANSKGTAGEAAHRRRVPVQNSANFLSKTLASAAAGSPSAAPSIAASPRGE